MNFHAVFSAVPIAILLSITGCSSVGTSDDMPIRDTTPTTSAQDERIILDVCQDGTAPTNPGTTSEYASVENGEVIRQDNSITVNGDIGSGAYLHARSGGANTHIAGNVSSYTTVRTDGGGAATLINGDVANNSVVVTAGGSACLTVTGSVGENSIIIASGSGSRVNIGGDIAPTARICVLGSFDLFVKGERHSDGVINGSHDIVTDQDCHKLLLRLEDEWATSPTVK